METMLKIENLTKDHRSDWTFRPTRVLSSLNLEVYPGECFGLLGPNGAGKTTTFKLILGFLRPTSGRVSFQDAPLTTAAHAFIGFLPEQPYFYEYLTVRETLALFADLYGVERGERRKRIDEVVARVGLGPKINAALRSLSKGTLQRVGVAQAILNRPRLLVLDEPMSGLDPIGRHQMRELIRSIRDAGTSVIFSSHILPDAEAICDRVGILANGQLQQTITLADHSDADQFELTIGLPGESLRSEIATLPGVALSANGRSCTATLPNQQSVDRVIDLVRTHGVSIENLRPLHTSLEEEFLRHVGTSPSAD